MKVSSEIKTDNFGYVHTIIRTEKNEQFQHCGQESLRRNVVAIMVNKRVWNALLGCNFKSDRMVSVLLEGKPFNITVIQVHAPTSKAQEAEV